FEDGAVGQRLAAVDDGDVVEAEKASLKDVVAFAVDLVDPPGEIDEQLVEALFEKLDVGLAGLELVGVIDAPHRAGMHRWIEVRKLPFIRRDLAVGMQELFEEQEPKLIFGKGDVDEAEGNAMKRKVPGGEPGIFPFVGDGENS